MKKFTLACQGYQHEICCVLETLITSPVTIVGRTGETKTLFWWLDHIGYLIHCQYFKKAGTSASQRIRERGKFLLWASLEYRELIPPQIVNELSIGQWQDRAAWFRPEFLVAVL